VTLAAAVLLVVAVGLLAGGLAQGSAQLQWGSFAASLLAGLVLVVGELRRRARERRDPRSAARRRAARGRPPRAHPEPAPAGPDGEVRRVSPPPVPPSNPAMPRVDEPASGPATQHGPVTPGGGIPRTGPNGDPPAEEAEFTDLLVIMDLADEVLVVHERPRYHLARCPYLAGELSVPLPLHQARTDGFTPCGTCTPDRTLAARERARRA